MARTLAPALVFALLVGPASAARAQEPPPPPPDPVQTRKLTLVEALREALANNVNIEVARIEPLIAREQVSQARGAFDPVGFSRYGFDHRETPIASTVQAAFGTAGPLIDEDEWNYSGGFEGLVPFGLSYESSYNFRRLDSTSGFNALDREYRPVWENRLTLPLLRDFRHNEANVRVKQRRVSREVSDEQFRQFLIDELVRVEEAYWGLAAERASVGVAEKSLQTVQDLLEQTRVQYEVGVVSRVNVTQAEAGVAEREVTVITAENRAGTAQDRLLNLIRAPDPETYLSIRLEAEDPAYVEYSADEERAIETAMELRPELAAARDRVELAEIELGFRRNQRLPRLDVVGSYAFNGLSGPVKAGLTDSMGNPVTDIPGVDTGSTSGHNNFFKSRGTRDWGFAARVEIPIGNRTRRHRAIQAQIELRRARADLKRAGQEVILDVRTSARNLRSAIEALEAAERRRIAQEETLRAERERLRLGDSTPFLVLEQEQDLAEAEEQEIRSLQVYRNNIAQLERARGTLLQTLGVSVAEEIER